MTNPVMVVRDQITQDDKPIGRGCWLWCPGCDMAHRPQIIGEAGESPAGPCWDWDGNLEKPTFSPSILVHGSVHQCGTKVIHYDVCPDPDECGSHGHYISPEGLAHVKPCPHGLNGDCHSFIRNGMWEFLGDCAHSLAGQTVPMVPLPDWLVD